MFYRYPDSGSKASALGYLTSIRLENPAIKDGIIPSYPDDEASGGKMRNQPRGDDERLRSGRSALLVRTQLNTRDFLAGLTFASKGKEDARALRFMVPGVGRPKLRVAKNALADELRAGCRGPGSASPATTAG